MTDTGIGHLPCHRCAVPPVRWTGHGEAARAAIVTQLARMVYAPCPPLCCSRALASAARCAPESQSVHSTPRRPRLSPPPLRAPVAPAAGSQILKLLLLRWWGVHELCDGWAAHRPLEPSQRAVERGRASSLTPLCRCGSLRRRCPRFSLHQGRSYRASTHLLRCKLSLGASPVATVPPLLRRCWTCEAAWTVVLGPAGLGPGGRSWWFLLLPAQPSLCRLRPFCRHHRVTYQRRPASALALLQLPQCLRSQPNRRGRRMNRRRPLRQTGQMTPQRKAGPGRLLGGSRVAPFGYRRASACAASSCPNDAGA